MGMAIKKARFIAFVVLVKLEAKTHHFYAIYDILTTYLLHMSAG